MTEGKKGRKGMREHTREGNERRPRREGRRQVGNNKNEEEKSN